MIQPGEIIIDSFAGGGGASLALMLALGREPDIAINHDPEAVAMHKANHPATRHYCQNIWKAHPRDVTEGRRVGVMWFSPDCTHHSKAKGGKPLENRRRDLAWVVIAWAKAVRPRIIFLENVEEFANWGPLVDGRPCPDRKGHTFKRWVRELRALGYSVDWRELRACDYGAPTTRKRLFLVARCDGAPIKWPDPTHAKNGAGGLLPWRSAAEIINWSLRCPSIFLTPDEARAIGCKRPLAEATMARIARGVKRYILDAAEPFILNLTHHGSDRNESINEPLRTLTCAHRGEKALVAAHYGEGSGGLNRAASVAEPLRTITCDPRHSLVAAFLAQHNGGMTGHAAAEPVSTIVHRGSQQQLVAAHLMNLKGSDRRDRDAREPAFTVTSGGHHIAEVRAFLMKYYGADQAPELHDPIHTITSKARFGLVMVHGEPYEIADIGMRMLARQELFAAQGFPPTYRLDVIGPKGTPLTNTALIKLCGNSVSPPPAAALIRANIAQVPRRRRAPDLTPLEQVMAA